MSDIRRLLEAMDSMAKAEKKPKGPKFPGYWKGTDSASKARSKMVGSAEESVMKELHDTAKSKVTEWSLEEAYKQFKEAEEYKGIDPIVRQRMGMQPATQDEIRSYLDTNPTGIKTGSGGTVQTGSGQAVQSGGAVDVARAADAVSPDRAASVAKEPGTLARMSTATKPVEPVSQPTVKPVPDSPSTATTTNITPAATASTKPAVKPAPVIPAIPKNPASGSWQELYKHNIGTVGANPNLIKVGQKLKLPDDPEGASYEVQKGDTLSGIAAKLRGDMPKAKPTAPAVKVSAPAAPAPAAATTQKTSAAPTTQPTSGLSFADKKQAERYAQLHPEFRSNLERLSADSGIPITINSGVRTREEQAALAASGKARNAGYFGRVPTEPESHSGHAIDIPRHQLSAIHDWLEKNDPTGKKYGLRTGLTFKDRDPVHLQSRSYMPPTNVAMKENDDDEKIAGRYDPDDFDLMVARLGQKAKEQERKHGPVDIAKLAKRLRDIEVRDNVKEYENQQNPDSQITSPPSPAATASSQFTARDDILRNQGQVEEDGGAQDPAQQTTSPPSPTAAASPTQDTIKQNLTVATAKNTMAGLKPALGPKVDTNAAAQGVVKANTGQPLQPAEQEAIGALTPLVMKAVTTPTAAPQLKAALSNAATMSKAAQAAQGK